MRFNIDTLPLSKNHIVSNDYNGIVVYSAATDPLFKYDGKKISKHACDLYSVSKDGKIHTCRLRNDLFYPDGQSVNAIDYKRIILQAIKLTTPIQHDLENIESISVNALALTIHLKNPDWQFYKLLSKHNLSPLCGSFYIKQFNKTKITLLPNTKHRFYKKSMTALLFVVTDNFDTDLQSFTQNKTDFTCNTGFDYGFLNKFKSDLHCYPSFINMALTFINTDLLSRGNKKLRQAISVVINRAEIANKFNDALLPSSDFFLGFDKIKTCVRPTELNKRYDISIGYDDFYPNQQIAKMIKKHLGKINIHARLVKDNYYIPKFNYDIKLSLFFPDYIDNIAFYRSRYVKTLLKSMNKRTPPWLYKKSVPLFLLRGLNRYILKQGLIIPLFKMQSIYLSKNKTFDFKALNFGNIF
jgi:ABC-type oligopeptide transport system substrate-binding subunit